MKAITKSRRRIRILSLLLALVLIPQIITYSFAEDIQPRSSTSSPQAYFFVYNNGSTFDTTGCASNTILSKLWNMGFSAGSYLNNYATTIFSVINSKEVTVITGTGFWGETWLIGQSTTTNIHADRTYSLYEGINAIGTNDVVMSDLASNTSSDKTSNLVIIASSFSAETPPLISVPGNSYYNAPSIAGAMRSKVTDCAIGWTGQIHADTPEMELWLELFFGYCMNGCTINDAQEFADADLKTACDGSYDHDEGLGIYGASTATGYKHRYIDD